MPELPEVEVLVRHLRPALRGCTIRSVEIRRPRIVRPNTPEDLERLLPGSRIENVTRRGKYILFHLRPPARSQRRDANPKKPNHPLLTAHLGMTGRMYLLPARAPLPKHASVVLGLGPRKFVFEDPRYFGRFTLDSAAIERLGPEPLGDGFSAELLGERLARSRQSIKIKLLDQQAVAGIGNIYASEALFRAEIPPQKPANRLTRLELSALVRAIRGVLTRAIAFGSTVPLDFPGTGERDGLFYYGAKTAGSYEERLAVYHRAGQPCSKCRTPIRRLIQASRSTYYCPSCQPKRPKTS